VARTVRNSNLETRSARLKLTRERFFWCGVSKGLALGYRRTRKTGWGTWTARLLDPARQARSPESPYSYVLIGRADDYEDADGREILTYHQAADKARELAATSRGAGLELTGPYTVEDAARDYLLWFRVHRKSYAATKTVIDAHVLPCFRRRRLEDLTTRELQKWHEAIAATAARIRAPRNARGVQATLRREDPHESVRPLLVR